MEDALQRMIKQAQQGIPGLRRIDVLCSPQVEGGEIALVLEAYCTAETFDLHRPAWEAWSDWKVNAFPPDVHRHFALLITYETISAR